jgi:hypothetical protein
MGIEWRRGVGIGGRWWQNIVVGRWYWVVDGVCSGGVWRQRQKNSNDGVSFVSALLKPRAEYRNIGVGFGKDDKRGRGSSPEIPPPFFFLARISFSSMPEIFPKLDRPATNRHLFFDIMRFALPHACKFPVSTSSIFGDHHHVELFSTRRHLLLLLFVIIVCDVLTKESGIINSLFLFQTSLPPRCMSTNPTIRGESPAPAPQGEVGEHLLAPHGDSPAPAPQGEVGEHLLAPHVKLGVPGTPLRFASPHPSGGVGGGVSGAPWQLEWGA